MGQDSVVCTSTRYWMDGPSVEFRWWREVPRPSRPALVPTQPPTQRVPGHFPGVKGPERGINHPTPSRAEVKERVELYINSTCVSS